MTKKSTNSSRSGITGKAKRTVMDSASYLLTKTKKVLMVGLFAGLIYTKCAIQLIKDTNKDKT